MGIDKKGLKLKVHEWVAITTFIVLLLTISLITSTKETHLKFEAEIPIHKNGWIEVFVKGEVKQPGVYHIPSGLLFKDILDLAQVSSNADLRRYKLESIVKRSRSINIPKIVLITIYLTGAIKESVTLTLPKATRVEDLLGIAEFVEGANKRVLKKKRRLKDGEVIEIPFQRHLKGNINKLKVRIH